MYMKKIFMNKIYCSYKELFYNVLSNIIYNNKVLKYALYCSIYVRKLRNALRTKSWIINFELIFIAKFSHIIYNIKFNHNPHITVHIYAYLSNLLLNIE